MRSLLRLFFPRVCAVCGAPLVGDEQHICTRCMLSLPLALGAKEANNFVEKRFWGRIPIEAATSLLLFQRGNPSQKILHEIKYYGNERLARFMGRQLGNWIVDTQRFDDVDLIIPVPLHRRKERRRGYNQSLLLCRGISEVFPRPIETGNLIRQKMTDTQTHKNREQRLDNMQCVFTIRNPQALNHKHVLLIDDVITTGATTEACYQVLSMIEGLQISIASLAVAGDY